MWDSISRKSFLTFGVSALLVVAIACGGTANGDVTASATQDQPNQGANTLLQQTPDNTQVAMPAPSEEVTVPTVEAQAQADDSVPVPAPAPAPSTQDSAPVLVQPVAPSNGSVAAPPAPAPAPSTQDPAPAPAQPVAPSTGSVAAPPAPAPAAPVQVAPVGELDALAIVEAQEKVFIDLYERVLPSVVHIAVDRAVQGGFQPAGEGSGFVWDANGTIVTNHHVVENSDRVWVNFADGNVFLAQIVGTDPDSDLAALRIDVPAGYLKPVSLGDNKLLKVGQLALAIGSPFGETFTMTSGIISALGRTIAGAADSPYQIPSAIQTDAPINPGNSGGPLFDVRSNVIGINSQIISQSGSSAGIGFAIPINIAKLVIPELLATGSHRYTYLGISGGSLNSLGAEAVGLDRNTRGVIISALTAGGPAGKAGLLAPQGNNTRGDIITSIDGLAVRTIEDLIAYLAENTRPGQTIVVEVIRPNGSVESVDVLLEPRPGS